MYKIIVFISLIFFTIKSNAVDPIKIQITQFTNSSFAKPFLELSVNNQDCQLRINNEEKAVKIGKALCKKATKSLENFLSEPFGPSDYLNPKLKYYEVTVHSGKVSWTRIVQKDKYTTCTNDNKCTPPHINSAWKIVKILEEIFAIYLK